MVQTRSSTEIRVLRSVVGVQLHQENRIRKLYFKEHNEREHKTVRNMRTHGDNGEDGKSGLYRSLCCCTHEHEDLPRSCRDGRLLRLIPLK
jgi:hypothetical protein